MTNQYNKKNKRIQNLFRNLQKDSKSVFYSILNSSRALWNKAEKSVVDPKYCLLIVDLFTSKIYVYPMKNRSLLAKKLNLFYKDIKSKRTGKMCLKTDLEFNQD